MEYCASAASMLAEEIWQIAKGFVNVSANWQAQCGKYSLNFPYCGNYNVDFLEQVEGKLNQKFHTQCGKWKEC